MDRHLLEEYNAVSASSEWAVFWEKWYQGFGQDKGSWGVGPRVTIKITDDINMLKLRDLRLFYKYRYLGDVDFNPHI